MKTKNVKAPVYLRFRRWSRAGYAIFCSLACTVTIGCVAGSISDKSLQKELGVSMNTLSLMTDNKETDDKVKGLPDPEAQVLQTTLDSFLIVSATDATAAYRRNNSIFIFNRKG